MKTFFQITVLGAALALVIFFANIFLPQTAPSELEPIRVDQKLGVPILTAVPIPNLPALLPPPPQSNVQTISKPVVVQNPIFSPPPAHVPAPERIISDQEFYNLNSRAVIQIFCKTPQEYFSATGIIVNEAGLILTNAHVAGILAKVGEGNCEARHGNPATSFAGLTKVFSADMSSKITDTEVPQHDFAFLRLTAARESFTFSPMSLALANAGDRLFTLGYPSEFLEGIVASDNANLVFSSLVVGGLTDFDNDDTTADGYLFSGGIVLQQGSSGTPVFSGSGKVLGIIFATTKSGTTQDREGIAIATSAIDRELKRETGLGLGEFIATH